MYRTFRPVMWRERHALSRQHQVPNRTMTQFETNPIIIPADPIEDAWIDYNGHLNMAYYMVLFDRATDVVHEMLGMGPRYAQSRKLTTYSGEAHICYLKEVHQITPLTCTYQLIGHDEKRIIAFQQLLHPDGAVAATCETLTLHVDMSGPKVCPFPDDVMSNINALAIAHAAFPVPERAGRAIALKKKGA